MELECFTYLVRPKKKYLIQCRWKEGTTYYEAEALIIFIFHEEHVIN